MINVKAFGAVGDGGTTIYPNPASSGAWRRVPD